MYYSYATVDPYALKFRTATLDTYTCPPLLLVWCLICCLRPYLHFYVKKSFSEGRARSAFHGTKRNFPRNVICHLVSIQHS